jgi:hypothetical protein
MPYLSKSESGTSKSRWTHATIEYSRVEMGRDWNGFYHRVMMTHKYRGCIVVLSINKSVEPNEEQKVLMSGFDQGFTVNTSKQVFRGIW